MAALTAVLQYPGPELTHNHHAERTMRNGMQRPRTLRTLLPEARPATALLALRPYVQVFPSMNPLQTDCSKQFALRPRATTLAVELWTLTSRRQARKCLQLSMCFCEFHTDPGGATIPPHCAQLHPQPSHDRCLAASQSEEVPLVSNGTYLIIHVC